MGQYNFNNKRFNVFKIIAVDLNALKQGRDAKPRKAKMGRLLADTVVQFEKCENSSLNLVGKSKGYFIDYNYW